MGLKPLSLAEPLYWCCSCDYKSCCYFCRFFLFTIYSQVGFDLFKYIIQHCFNCLPSDCNGNVSEVAVIKPRTGAKFAWQSQVLTACLDLIMKDLIYTQVISSVVFDFAESATVANINITVISKLLVLMLHLTLSMLLLQMLPLKLQL